MVLYISIVDLAGKEIDRLTPRLDLAVVEYAERQPLLWMNVFWVDGQVRMTRSNPLGNI